MNDKTLILLERMGFNACLAIKGNCSYCYGSNA